jgi:hypothetical protein
VLSDRPGDDMGVAFEHAVNGRVLSAVTRHSKAAAMN